MRKDIDFSFKMHPLTGDLATKSGSSAIRQSLINLMRTNLGDRGFNIEVFSNIDAMMFENMTLLTANVLRDNIRNLIENFEPNIELLDVEVYDNGENELSVKILYNELNSAAEQNMVVRLARAR